MTNYPTIEEIKARHRMADVASHYVSNLKRSGQHLIGCCPFHDDRTASFVVFLTTDTWHCFGRCSVGGDVIDLIGFHEFRESWNSRDKAMFREALSKLEGNLPARRSSVAPDWLQPAVWQPIELDPSCQLLLDLAARTYHTELVKAGDGPRSPLGYLLKRGLTREIIREEGVGYCSGGRLLKSLACYGIERQTALDLNLLSKKDDEAGEADSNLREFMRGRIVFMDRDRAGRVLHMVGRKFDPTLHDSAPKYLSLKEMTKPLHGYAMLDRRESAKPVIVVESPPDRLTARQWGYDAVANIGTGMKAHHAALLRRLKRPKVIVPHNDENLAGLDAALRWKSSLGEAKLARLFKQVKDLNELAEKAPEAKKLFDELIAKVMASQSPALPAGDDLEGTFLMSGGLWL